MTPEWFFRSIHSLSMNSSADGGSGFNPFLFLMSAIIDLINDCGTVCHVLRYVFHNAFPAVPPRMISDKSKVSEAGTSPWIIEMTPF